MFKPFKSGRGLDQVKGGHQTGRLGVFVRLADAGAMKRGRLDADHGGGGGEGRMGHHGMTPGLADGIDHSGQGADAFVSEHGRDAVFPPKRGRLGDQEAGPLHGRIDGGLGFEERGGEGLGEFTTTHGDTFLRLAAG